MAIVLACSAASALALPIAETAQQASARQAAQQAPKGIVLPPSVLSTQPLNSVSESGGGNPGSELAESEGKLAQASGTDAVRSLATRKETDNLVFWIGSLVVALVALQLAFDSLDFSIFGIDSRARQRRRLQQDLEYN